MATYGKKAEKKVEAAMHERKRGELKSGSGDQQEAGRQESRNQEGRRQETGEIVPSSNRDVGDGPFS
jgi:hypothetical protein